MPRTPSTKSAAGTPRHPASGAEIRRYPRFPADLPADCREAGGAGRRWRGRTADVSGGGVALDLPLRLPRGTRLSLTVRTAIGPLDLEASVLWGRKAAGVPGSFRHGLQLPEEREGLDLPLTVLLGEWLRQMARQGKGARRPAVRPGRSKTPPPRA